MTLFCLDTNVIAAVIKGNATVLNHWVQAKRDGHDLAMSAMTYYEVRRGLDLPKQARKYAAFQGILRQMQVLIPDIATYDVAAEIYQKLKPLGLLIEDADTIIAATALRHGATLVTHNARHFGRIPGLSLTDWQQENP